MTTAHPSNFGSTVWQMTLMGLRYLRGRKLRTVLTTLAIVFGVAMIFAINLILPSMQEAFAQTMTSVTGADLTVTSVSGESFDPEAVLPTVSGIDQVGAVTGILHRQFSLPTLGNSSLGDTAQIDLVGIDPATIEDVHQFVVSDGRFLEPGDSGKALLPAGIAELAPELHVGTTFPLITAGGLKIYNVVGLMAEQGDLSSPQIYVTLADAQAAFNQPGLINTVEVSLAPGADRDAVAANIQQALGDSYTLDQGDSSSNTLAAMQVGLAMFDVLGLLALFLGAFLIFNTFRTVVVERRHDLGMLRAVGATRQQITLLIVIESLIQGLIGTAIGLLVGYLMALGMITAFGQIASNFFHRGDLSLQFSLPGLLGAAAIGLATALIAGYLPARTAGRTAPLEALRPSTPANLMHAARWSLIGGAVVMILGVLLLLTGKQGAAGGAILFLMGMVVAAPGLVIPVARLISPLLSLGFAREGDIARGNLVRQPGRAAITGSTLMIGLATLVMIAALVLSFAALINSLADANFSSDLILLPQSIAVYDTVVGADENLANRVRALPEVQDVGTMRYASSVTADGQALQVMGINPDDYSKVASFTVNEGTPEEAFAALGSDRNALFTAIALSTVGLQVGDDFVLQTAEGPQTYHVAGVANDLFTFKIAAIFISQANLAADFHKTEDVMLLINLVPGADKDAALANMQNILTDYPQFTAHLTGEYKQELADVTSGALVAFYGVAFLILIPAALGLLNTLTINILERTREIGVVRAVGGSRKQVRRIVTAEALLLGLFGAAMGVLSGVAMSYGFIAAFGTVGWDMPYFFPLAGIIAAVVVGVLLALFAAVLPARNAARLDIIRALQYE
ncbi:MAG: ABC transporter permease [Anaerolineae bacterium]|nr:ABC transporter permease [Anaerolineae bacterium]